ncbi:hypothetical protein [Paeniglutamicibacter terrestris]|uniref:Uncharacterized protein n=1 Tax=Paeniglutamicibacter terrestris TaxID=2723403 RepID=A0ABX1G603_9MICC|nr:hypothetical protein [Paeniglutamicibacter terrestris]NKG21075.1 hypothetical protein [Paeniglutamicibacter terrestris]
MSTASQGRAREYKVRDHMIAHNWVLIMRAAASKGPADLAMAHPEYGLALVQVGTDNKTLGPAARARFLEAAVLCSALPVIAQSMRGIKYSIVNAGPASGWEAWKP